MRASVIGIVLGACLLAACFVDRPSKTFECATQADCVGGRNCVSGYCIVPNCPSDCTSCDEAAHTCQVDCTSADDCAGTIDCPSGWACTISCIGAGACNDIVCPSGSECAITCSGAGACGDVDCRSACECNLECAPGACASMSCPVVGNGANQVQCTVDGTVDTACESARDPGCTKC